MVAPDLGLANASRMEAAARAAFLRMTPRKWRLVRVSERIIRLLLPLLPPPLVLEKSEALPSSILVVEYWNLGDLAIIVPFLKNLRRSYPEARISLLVNAGLVSFLQGQGLVDEIIAVRVPWAQHFSRWKKYNPFSPHWISLARMIWELRKRQFDWAISGRMDLRDNLLMWLLGTRRRIGFGLGGGGFLLTDRVAPDLQRPHRVDVWLRLLEGVGVPVNREPGEIRLGAAERADARAFLVARGIPNDALVVGVHPGARIATRRWGDERFAEMTRRVLSEANAHILWFSEPGAASAAPDHERCHPVNLEFRPFIGVLSLCRLLVCNDSGPMHIAGLLGVPVVAVFGATNPVWFGPRGVQDRVLIRPEFWCRPCFDYCIFDEPWCLRTISVEEVSRTVSERVKQVRDGARRTSEEMRAAVTDTRGR
jgi:ADP-heptose:LPS heptosyltransferase